jgi:ABC-type multidrug transport system ATPase subunit
VLIVNNAIDELLKKAGELQGSIAKQKILIEKLVKENSDGINGFLKNAGYQYKVNLIEDKSGQYRLKLVHNDIKEEVSNVKAHLSFGERNAFSLVLFMYDALKNRPDLIVLDDPISSFDKNKKYAIIEMLFRKDKSFRGKSVLLLTHDFEPIVDMVYHHSDRFLRPFATFLENKHGTLSEKEIAKSDIKTFLDINRENLNLNLHDINKLVYLRRLYEVTNVKKLGYDVVSNLFHKRENLTRRENETSCEMTTEEIRIGCDEVKEIIPSFNYKNLLQLVKNESEMKALYSATTNNYEKLHLYRIIFDDKTSDIESDIIQKFINEAFHIENDYIYQLNPCEYQLVPQYVIDECDKFIADGEK